MVADQIRYWEKFTSADGLQEVVFPLANYAGETSQSFRVSLSPVVGASYSRDHSGASPWSKENAEAVVRFMLYSPDHNMSSLNDQLDEIIGQCREFGLGWLVSTDDRGIRRKTQAKLIGRPEFVSAVASWQKTPVILRFDLQGNARDTDEIEIIEPITSSPHQFLVNNPGNAAVEAVVIQFKANIAPNAFEEPEILNISNGYQFGVARTSAAIDDEIRVDAENYLVEWSDDNGVTYTPDYANFTKPTRQAAFFRLGPGDNLIEVTDLGTPDYDLVITFSPEWH